MRIAITGKVCQTVEIVKPGSVCSKSGADEENCVARAEKSLGRSDVTQVKGSKKKQHTSNVLFHIHTDLFADDHEILQDTMDAVNIQMNRLGSLGRGDVKKHRPQLSPDGPMGRMPGTCGSP